jgi:hypothetical protein
MREDFDRILEPSGDAGVAGGRTRV